jgi:hypothetical protein
MEKYGRARQAKETTKCGTEKAVCIPHNQGKNTDTNKIFNIFAFTLKQR